MAAKIDKKAFFLCAFLQCHSMAMVQKWALEPDCPGPFQAPFFPVLPLQEGTCLSALVCKTN